MIKIYLDVSEKVQRERVKKMAAGTNTRWDVVKEERKESKNYQKYKSAMDEIIRESWSSNGRWKIVNADDLDRCSVELFEYIIEELETNLEKRDESEGVDYSYSGSDIHYFTIHSNVFVTHQLTCTGTRGSKTQTIHNVVETRFEELKQNYPCYTRFALSFFVKVTELFFQTAISIFGFLFFA